MYVYVHVQHVLGRWTFENYQSISLELSGIDQMQLTRSCHDIVTRCDSVLMSSLIGSAQHNAAYLVGIRIVCVATSKPRS